jgi:hypothetical protein
MLMIKGRIELLPRLYFGGKYAGSHFKDTTCTDTDWIPDFDPGVWLESNSRCEPDIDIFDLNFYYTLLDLSSEEAKKKTQTKEWFDLLRVDKLSLDAFVGYQEERGYYRATDLVDTVEWWTSVYNPIPGLDSYYKVCYRGPRLGLSAEGSAGKVSTRLSFAYAWLHTAAKGWWNLMNYSFEQRGSKGYGLDVELETTYHITPNFSAGLGYNYLFYRQKRLTESGSIPGVISYENWDIIRNVDSSIYGPSFLLRYHW